MSSPRKREKKTIVDPVNEPRALVLTNQTYCYGETPTVVCRQHFQNIAKSLNLSVEEFAKTVLDKSIGDQLCMLRDFYKTQNEETEKIYNPLIELSSTESGSRKLPDCSPTNSPQKITTVKTRIPSKQKGPSTKRSHVLVSSPETEVSVSNQPTKFSEGKIKKKEKSKNISKFSSIQASIEATITSQGASNTKEFTSISSASEDFNSNNTSEHLTECEQRTEKGTDESQSIIEDNSTDRPTQRHDEECTTKEKNAKDTMTNEGEETSRDPDKDDFDTFLYGRSPSRPKAAPKKKSRFSHSTTNTSNDRHRPASPSSVHTPCESPPPHEFLTPGLTFDSTSWSPSRQRDLLSVARDIADLQKAVAAGEKLNDSVSNTILFTKP